MRYTKNYFLDGLLALAVFGLVMFFAAKHACAAGTFILDKTFAIDHRIESQIKPEPIHTCRSQSQKHKFDVQNGYKGTRPQLKGEERWIVDHWCALECGGIDDPVNMVYQQYTESKKKDEWERTPEGCARTCNALNSTPTRQVFNCKPKRVKKGV